MIKNSEILFTGGSGLLGGEMKKVLKGTLFPSSSEFNITDHAQMERYLAKHRPNVIIHAAAFTSPPRIDQDPQKALQVNIVGTANLANLCFKRNIKLVYICTDYVYKGDQGRYKEDDPVLPQNKYAWSKLGGECAARLLDDSLIVRIAMGEKVFPYEKAFVDHFTSRETADVIAKKIVRLVRSGATGVYNVGAKRRSLYQFAQSLNNKKPVGKLSIKDVNFKVPQDTSFNTKKFNALFRLK